LHWAVTTLVETFRDRWYKCLAKGSAKGRWKAKLYFLSKRAGTLRPDAPIYWPPKSRWNLPRTFREAYEGMIRRGVSVGTYVKHARFTPQQLLKIWDDMGFNIDPAEVSLPYIGGWVGCKQWKKKREEIWTKRPHRCFKCDKALHKVRGGYNTHHLDGDARNNDDDNLVLLCPFCHGRRLLLKRD